MSFPLEDLHGEVDVPVRGVPVQAAGEERDVRSRGEPVVHGKAVNHGPESRLGPGAAPQGVSHEISQDAARLDARELVAVA